MVIYNINIYHHFFYLAPGVGFEPTGVISSHKFSRLGAYDRLRTPAYGVLNPVYITFPVRDR